MALLTTALVTCVIYGRMHRVVGLVWRNTKGSMEIGTVHRVYALNFRLLTSAYSTTLDSVQWTLVLIQKDGFTTLPLRRQETLNFQGQQIWTPS